LSLTIALVTVFMLSVSLC